MNKQNPENSDHDSTDRLAECDIPSSRYRVFIEDVADAFFETDIKGNFVFFNDALCRIFGYARDEIQGRSFRGFMDAENAAMAFDSFNSMFRTGSGVDDLLWEITRKDGKKRILEIHAKLLDGDSGRRVGFQGVARDITETVKTQAALKASENRARKQYRISRQAEQRYRGFLEFLPIPVFVFNIDSTVSYLNPSFERVFGWSLDGLKGKQIDFIPENHKERTKEGIRRLYKEKRIYGFETKRFTKDGRLLDIILDGALFYDEDGEPAGQVVTLRDVTEEKRNARSNKALARIANALHEFRLLDERLEYITNEIKDLISIEGASIVLLDEENAEFYFQVTAYEDPLTGQKMKEIRFPVEKGIAGQVYRTRQPLIVQDTSKSPYFFKQVDDKSGYETRSMLDVPIQIQERMIGVICAVNKKEGRFDQTDVDLLSAIANMVALPIENARINEALSKSYEEVKGLNRAKDRAIHHLSHEIKTPISVLSASLNLLKKKKAQRTPQEIDKILKRADRNLGRMLDMQYEIEDIVGQRDYKSHALMSSLLDACADEIEVLVSDTLNSESAAQKIRDKIEDIFGPRKVSPEEIRPDLFIAEQMQTLGPRFAHRELTIETRFQPAGPILIPREVLSKIVEGLVRNAVENTPDGGLIQVAVTSGEEGPIFKVKDYGIGITEENQRLIFDNYFTAYEPADYASRKPYDFNAGGKGFDLIRLKIFSERYHFKLDMSSVRCEYLAETNGLGPGRIEACEHCRNVDDCLNSGGTTMTVQFIPADRSPLQEP
ncbi:MAG: PAS domain S-box protein [Deltaproteobacteria bacterium]|nr:PAS domain S-box protein [Deltaproteobacteria bacterium]